MNGVTCYVRCVFKGFAISKKVPPLKRVSWKVVHSKREATTNSISSIDRRPTTISFGGVIDSYCSFILSIGGNDLFLSATCNSRLALRLPCEISRGGGGGGGDTEPARPRGLSGFINRVVSIPVLPSHLISSSSHHRRRTSIHRSSSSSSDDLDRAHPSTIHQPEYREWARS